MFANGQVMMMPCKSLVKNCGYDGSGVNCGAVQFTNSDKHNHRNYDFANQPIDESNIWDELSEVSAKETIYINQLIDKFFEIPFIEYARAYICYMSVCLFGIKRIKKIIDKLM